MINYNSLLKRNIWNEGDKSRELYSEVEEVIESKSLPVISPNTEKYVLGSNGVITEKKTIVLSINLTRFEQILVGYTKKGFLVSDVSFYNNSVDQQVYLLYGPIGWSRCINMSFLKSNEYLQIPFSGLSLKIGEKLSGYCDNGNVGCIVQGTEY